MMLEKRARGSRLSALATGLALLVAWLVMAPVDLAGAAASVPVPLEGARCPQDAPTDARSLPKEGEIEALSIDPHVKSFVERTGDAPESVALLVILQEGIGRLRATLASTYPESFGGLWVDNVGSAIEISIAVLPGKEGDMLRGAACSSERPELLRFVAAEVSYQALEDDVRRVSAWRDASGLRESAPFDISIDERAGMIVLETTTDVALLGEARGKVTHPGIVAIRQVEEGSRPSSCTRTNCSPNLVGGLALSGCSTGFTARAGSARGVLTAAHCGNYQSHDALSVGSVIEEQESGSVDAQFHAASSYWVELAQVLDFGLVSVYGIQRITDDFVGGITCKAGKVTGVTCGPIESRNYAPSYVDGSFGFRRADFNADDGDSGGAVYTVNRGAGILWAAGIHSGETGGGDGIYGHIGYVENALGVRVLTPSAK